MKITTDVGNGEGKLWVGQKTNESELDSFFEFNSIDKYSCFFSRNNLIDYLLQVKFEYVYQKFNHYNNVSLVAWNENLDKIKSLSDTDFSINLEKKSPNFICKFFSVFLRYLPIFLQIIFVSNHTF